MRWPAGRWRRFLVSRRQPTDARVQAVAGRDVKTLDDEHHEHHEHRECRVTPTECARARPQIGAACRCALAAQGESANQATIKRQLSDDRTTGRTAIGRCDERLAPRRLAMFVGRSERKSRHDPTRRVEINDRHTTRSLHSSVDRAIIETNSRAASLLASASENRRIGDLKPGASLPEC